MKLSISNIAWQEKNDDIVYSLMSKYGYTGLEIAPTRIIPVTPYDKLDEIELWSKKLNEQHGLSISSMQSIWYGKQENLFASFEEREILISYTKKAVDFAKVIGCGNLVFGCPKNRNLPNGVDQDLAVPFFKCIGDYAASQGTVVAMEANPTIYNTNYINDTLSAIDLVKQVDSHGLLLNLDVGAMIENGESICELKDNVKYVNHVHISEPYLKLIEKRDLHKELMELLKSGQYSGYVSIEMQQQDNMKDIEKSLAYVKEISV